MSYGMTCCSQEEDPNRSIKKPLGDTNHFCPVALKEQDILWPGNPEVTAKYRERYYYCSTNEAREKFIADPTFYLPKGKPPKVGWVPNIMHLGLFVCLFVCLSVCLSVFLSVCLFVCLSVCLSVCLFVCLSVGVLKTKTSAPTDLICLHKSMYTIG